jgi:DUF971 family protein
MADMSDNPSTGPWPSELRLNPEKVELRVAFTNGFSETLAAELLRVSSPSAEVQGHSPSERKLVAGKRNVSIAKIEPIGNYAVRIDFSDGHNTGIYTWHYLYELGKKKEQLWESYLKEIAVAGLSRDPHR